MKEPPARAHRQGTQLRLGLGPGRDERPAFILTSALRRHRSRQRLEGLVRYCLGFFPELHGHTFGVGVTRQALGLASLESFAIWLNPYGLTLHTISHELTHLVQARGLLPHGERACDLFALARHPSLNDARPNYLDVPDAVFDERHRTRAGWSGVLHGSAVAAVGERRNGRRRYICWFENEIARLASAAVVEA